MAACLAPGGRGVALRRAFGRWLLEPPGAYHRTQTAVVGEEVPCPVEQHRRAVAKSHQEDQMDQEPGPPSGPARQLEAEERSHGAVATDRGHRALVPVLEGKGWMPAQRPQEIQRRRSTLLDGDGS